MKLFKRKKRLEEIDDCPYIKRCKFKSPGILYSCENGEYTDCLIYRSNMDKDKETKKEEEKQ
ncbi:hypothetical protein ES703_20526 [subsurface metagenome]